MILHFIDNLDAKLASVSEVFEKDGVQPGGWSSFDRLLERPIYMHNLIPEQ